MVGQDEIGASMRTSRVGLTADASGDELVLGSLPKTNDNISCLDELDKFESIKDRIINIHLRGHLENEWWAIDNAPFTFDEALAKIQDGWRYRGLLTLEPERGPSDVTWEDLLVALRNLRNCKH